MTGKPRRRTTTRKRHAPPGVLSRARWSGYWHRWRTAAGRTASVLLIAGVGYGVWGILMDPATLPLKQVKLEGPFEQVSAAQLHEVIAPQAHGGFFNVGVNGVIEALTALPWVDRVGVRREWPDTLRVTVVEQQALARWADGGLINLRGERFTPADDGAAAGLAQLQGPPGTERLMAQRYREIAPRLAASGIGLKRLVLTSRRAWELELDNGLSVALGRGDVALRLERLARFYPNLAAEQDRVRRVDMRYTNGFAVQWRWQPQA